MVLWGMDPYKPSRLRLGYSRISLKGACLQSRPLRSRVFEWAQLQFGACMQPVGFKQQACFKMLELGHLVSFLCIGP